MGSGLTWVEWLRQVLIQATPWFTVRPWEQGVRLWMGKNRRLLGPGFYFKVPVLHQALVFPIRLRTAIVPMQTLRSKDGRTVTISLILKYRVADLFLVLDTLHNPEATLGHIVQGSVSDLVPTLESQQVTTERIRASAKSAVDAKALGIDEFDVLVSDNADLSGRTLRLIQEGRWFPGESEIDKMATHA